MSSEFERALAPATLWAAWQTVRDNKGRGGVDEETAAAFARDAEAKLARLRREVLEGRYRPAPLLRLRIPKKTLGERTLAIPSVRDRILQTAFCRVLQPILEPQFETCSYAYRPGRSIPGALAAIDRFRRQGYGWLLDGDIENFFDEVDHARLCRLLAPHLADPRSLGLIRTWLAGMGDARGVPQGSPLSPLLSNLYLDGFDEGLLASRFRPIRYSDDFVVLCQTWEDAAAARQLVASLLAGLDLRLAERKTRIVRFADGFCFLGAQFDDQGFTADWLKPARQRGTRRVRLIVATPEVTMLTPPPTAAVSGDYADWSDAADPVPALSAGLEPAPEAAAGEPAAAPEPLLRTLYITSHGTHLGVAGERFVIRRQGGASTEETPAAHVDLILLLGYVQVSTQAALFCARRRIPLVYLSANGAFRAWLTGLDGGHVELHYRQAACVNDPDWALAAARQCVAAKISNAKVVLERYLRHRPEMQADNERASMRRALGGAERADTLERLRGFEGAAALSYFSAWKRLLPPVWAFTERNRRPPADPVNALLSLGYSLLYHNIVALLVAEGLNPLFGFFHPPRNGHAGLASDLMEEFRAVTVDAIVWSMVLNRRIDPAEFSREEGACQMGREVLPVFLKAFEAKLNSRIEHPSSGETLDYRRLIQKQVRLLKQAIGAQAEYTAFRVR